MPWMTKALLVSTRKKNKLYKRFMAKRNPTRESRYKKYKNKLIHLIKAAKKAYYEKRFDAIKNNQKATWKLINEVINKRMPPSSLPSSFKTGSCTLTDPKDIANSFCKFFANIGPELASKIPNLNVSFRSFLDLKYSETIFLCPTNKNELQDICYSFKTGKAPCFDNVSMYVIKKSFDLLVQPLANIINLSLCTAIFPEKLKIAKVIPIFKTGEQNSFTNYRPISLLSNSSKFFEKVMHNRLTSFIERHEIIYSLQFGFRKRHSTCHSLISLTNNIASDIDRGHVAAGVFIDLSKAFDTLDHQILFSKLEHYGVRGVALKWIKSYLSNRKQFVKIKDTCSECYDITCGVPQGSILGPLLFILYVNDLRKALKRATSSLFADDTSIYYSHSDVKQLETTLNSELRNLDTWMKSNKLSVNITKSNYLIFHPSQRKLTPNLILKYDNQILVQKRHIKFLGVYLDENLSWKIHINYISKKISKSVGIIYRSRYLLSSATKRSLYYGLIYPYVTYCNVVWSSTYETNVKRIHLLQKRAVRAMTNSDYHAHSAPLSKKLNILDIFKLNTHCIGTFMHSYSRNLLPACFDNLYISSNQVHNHNTRAAAKYRSHACRTNIKQFTILHQGPEIWNRLPSSITGINNTSSFKRKLQKYLIGSN